MTPSRHLLTLWNPAYATDALEAHLRVLLEHDQRCTAGTASSDDVFVWWGKVRSSQRQQPMPHLHDILAMGTSLADASDDEELHLYLTDYRSLYVADVSVITAIDPRAADGAHVPAYYTDTALNCDCWFALSDIRAIVRDDLEGVAAELALLRNTRYADRPVSMYGGMVDLPLIVARPDGRTYFSDAERELYTNGALWARFDAEHGGVGALEATLRDDHFGARTWTALDASARRFLAMAERTHREHRRDPAADLSQVLVGYGKAIEAQVNETLRRALHAAPEPARLVKLENHTARLPEALPLSLGQIARALGGERDLSDYLRKTLHDGAWFTNEFAAIIDAFADARNPSAHGSTVVPREVVTQWRNRLLGVGCNSVIRQLVAVQPLRASPARR